MATGKQLRVAVAVGELVDKDCVGIVLLAPKLLPLLSLMRTCVDSQNMLCSIRMTKGLVGKDNENVNGQVIHAGRGRGTEDGC